MVLLNNISDIWVVHVGGYTSVHAYARPSMGWFTCRLCALAELSCSQIWVVVNAKDEIPICAFTLLWAKLQNHIVDQQKLEDIYIMRLEVFDDKYFIVDGV